MARKQQQSWETENNPFAVRLRTAMKIKNITQQELAQKTGIARQTVSNYQNGQSLPNTDLLYAISRALDISADWLIGGREEIISTKSEEDTDIRAYLSTSAIAALSVEKICGERERADFISFILSQGNLLDDLIKAVKCMQIAELGRDSVILDLDGINLTQVAQKEIVHQSLKNIVEYYFWEMMDGYSKHKKED